MRKQHKFGSIAKAFTGSLLLGSLTAFGGELRQQSLPWTASPFRNFEPAQPLTPGVLFSDEANDPALKEALSAQITRLSGELVDRQGWPAPFAPGDPLRIFVSRREADGVRRLVVQSVERRRLIAPRIEIDASKLSDGEIVREASRLFARAVVSSYGVDDGGFVTEAAAELLSGNGDSEEAAEEAREVAAAPSLSVADHPSTMGRLFLDEFLRAAGGRGALRGVWDRASERGEDPLASLLQIYAEQTGEAGEALVVRFAARLYATLETAPGPSGIGLYDLETGAFDAAAPAAWTLRHRTFVPGEMTRALRFHWPAGAGEGAAVVRYQDPDLPPDVVLLSAGSVHTLPLSGVARVDWVVAGAVPSGPPAPAFFEPADGIPFSGLLSQSLASPAGSRLRWTTDSRDGRSSGRKSCPTAASREAGPRSFPRVRRPRNLFVTSTSTRTRVPPPTIGTPSGP
jgi:hypothetical protein